MEIIEVKIQLQAEKETYTLGPGKEISLAGEVSEILSADVALCDRRHPNPAARAKLERAQAGEPLGVRLLSLPTRFSFAGDTLRIWPIPPFGNADVYYLLCIICVLNSFHEESTPFESRYIQALVLQRETLRAALEVLRQVEKANQAEGPPSFHREAFAFRWP